jgi:hypothetical protein
MVPLQMLAQNHAVNLKEVQKLTPAEPNNDTNRTLITRTWTMNRRRRYTVAEYP